MIGIYRFWTSLDGNGRLSLPLMLALVTVGLWAVQAILEGRCPSRAATKIILTR